MDLLPYVTLFNNDLRILRREYFSAVLDGIGKGLDPRFDITEIAKP